MLSYFGKPRIPRASFFENKKSKSKPQKNLEKSDTETQKIQKLPFEKQNNIFIFKLQGNKILVLKKKQTAGNIFTFLREEKELCGTGRGKVTSAITKLKTIPFKIK